MRFLTLFFLTALSVTTPQLAQAGWISAGGGELFGDTHNPWFVKNVSDVSYCISVADTSVSADKAQVQGLVADSIQYWKNEFNRVASTSGASQFSLGTQNFTEVDCTNPNVALQFNIGYETLGPAQVQWLVTPLNYIGIAVRTDYDSDLRGKGFIFIASDKGPNCYHGGTDKTLIAQAWKNPQLLKYAILHELGHVFGMPHTGSSIMSETFLEQMLSTNLADDFIQAPIPSFFSANNTIEICQDLANGNTGFVFFGAPTGDHCLKLDGQFGGNGGQWTLSSRADQNSTALHTLGRIAATDMQLGDLQSSPTIVFQLMGNTTVFTTQETLFRSFMFGPRFVTSGIGGNFIPSQGASKSVYVKIGPDSIVITGTVNNKIQPVFSYSSPIGILLMKNPVPSLGRGE